MPDSGLTDNVSFYTSTFHDTYVRQQVITTCTSATRPTGVEGRVIFETDTDLLLAYNGSTWLPFAGPTTGGTSFTPQIDQGASTNIAKTVTHSEYRYVGFKTIHWAFDLAVTAAGTSGSAVTLGVPVTASAAHVGGGAGHILDQGVGYYSGHWSLNGTTSIQLFCHNETGAAGVDPAFALANTDVIRGSITYEIA